MKTFVIDFFLSQAQPKFRCSTNDPNAQGLGLFQEQFQRVVYGVIWQHSSVSIWRNTFVFQLELRSEFLFHEILQELEIEVFSMFESNCLKKLSSFRSKQFSSDVWKFFSIQVEVLLEVFPIKVFLKYILNILVRIRCSDKCSVLDTYSYARAADIELTKNLNCWFLSNQKTSLCQSQSRGTF